MPKGIKNKIFQVKYAVRCGRAFIWRKMEKVWNDVKYCSDACRKNMS
jgi:hypothetical protein